MIYGDLFSAIPVVVYFEYVLRFERRESRFRKCGNFVAVQLRRPRVFLWQLFKLIFLQQ